jgi:hypothetical protein
MLRLVARRAQHGGRKRYATDALRSCQGALSLEPNGRMVTHACKHGSSDLLFAFTELRTYPTPCCLHYGHIGLITTLLLAVLSHRLADALRSIDRGTTPRSLPYLGACAL